MLAAVLNGRQVKADLWSLAVVFTVDPEGRRDVVGLTRALFDVVSVATRKRGEAAYREWEAAADRCESRIFRAVPLPVSIGRGPQHHIARTWASGRALFSGFDPLQIDHRIIPCRINPRHDGPVYVANYPREQMLARHDERLRSVRANGVETEVLLVQANNAAFAPGEADLPGLALLTFDASLGRDRQAMMDIAHRAYELKSRPPQTADERVVAEFMADETAFYHRRFRLPPAFTGGKKAYLADIWLVRRFLPAGRLDGGVNELRCIAQPGDQGGIELLPQAS